MNDIVKLGLKRINSAISEIRKKTPWIGIVLQQLELVMDNTFPRAATNGKQVFFNPDFAAGLLDDHIQGTLVHEALHVIQRHMFRQQDRDQRDFNIAADHAINGLVNQMGYVMPDGALEPIWETAERIYGQRKDKFSDFGDRDNGSNVSDEDSNEQSTDSDTNSDTGDSDSAEAGAEESKSQSDDSADSDGASDSEGGDSGQQDAGLNDDLGDILDYPLEPGQTMADAERELNDMLAKAQVTAAICGDTPTESERELFKPVDTKVDWHAEMAEFIDQAGAADYSLLPPNLLLSSQGIIANRLNPSGCGHVVLVVDNSSSMDDDKLNQAIAELSSLIENIDYESLRIIACDTEVNFDQLFERGESIDIDNLHCGGGTRFLPAFEHVAEIDCDVLVYFTDMEVFDARKMLPPNYPVLWAVYGTALDNGEWSDSHLGWDYFAPDWGYRISI